jgi:hypothetical protein
MDDQDIPESFAQAWRDLLRSDAWFMSAPPGLRAALMRLGRLPRLGPGEALFARGQAAGLTMVRQVPYSELLGWLEGQPAAAGVPLQ